MSKPKVTVVAKPKAQPVAKVSTSKVEEIIRTAARKHGVSEDYLVRIAKCESGLNPNAVNRNYYAGGGNPTGVFQYLPETWNRIGGRSPYGVGNIYNAQDQANVTAWAFANGYSGEWACR